MVDAPLSCCGGAHLKTPVSRNGRACGSAPPAVGPHSDYFALERTVQHVARPANNRPLQGGVETAPWKFKREGFILSFVGPLTDSYDVEPRKLGQGTYGSVCRAVNKSTKTVRAVKTISKSKVRNVKRFKQEISIMKSLDHPNIIKLFETFEDHKNVYLVMELCRGGELFDRIIEQGYFSEAYACSLMRCILAALFYLHRHGIVHRDLKPENFMFLDKGKDAPFKIIDFGLATRFSNNSYMSTRAGTPFYVAPQVLQGKYTYKCDMWSAGVILYILLCGYPPFHGENDAEILARVKVGRYKFNEHDWKGVSSEAKDLVRKLMAFDPHQRLSAEQALNHPWIKHFSSAPNPATDAPFSRTMLDHFRNPLRSPKVVALSIDCRWSRGHAISGHFTPTVTLLVANFCLQHWTRTETEALRFKSCEEDVCWAAFRVFDLDGNGRISAQDLAHVLLNTDVQSVFPSPGSGNSAPHSATPAEDDPQREGHKGAVHRLSPQEKHHQMQQIRSIIREVDRNGDGEIDFDEFMDMMRRSTMYGL
ncbi:CAM kinase, CDPK family, putative [Eimeria brunetti]|uniref:Calcium-dependent protein kinase 1 n=1 Tax=Eimeria brunetti TaxID=51314 RepID=U6LP87_9EIME|nr:CAM kinase, CDPK family, putative [Eimeria brunetti]